VDLHDLLFGNKKEGNMTFNGDAYSMNSVCCNCGERYGDHSGLVCPDDRRDETGHKHWICYVEGTDGGKRYKHSTLDSAQTEAERLARLTGKMVSVYEYKGVCKVELAPIVWEVPWK